jgi:hypothetical protein
MGEAPNPHGMVPASTPYIYKEFEFETIHMLWKGRWVHHHTTSTILVCQEFREVADLLGHSKATNDVKVQ